MLNEPKVEESKQKSKPEVLETEQDDMEVDEKEETK